MSEDQTVRATDEDGKVKIYREGSSTTAADGSTTHIMTTDSEDLKTKALRAENAVTDLVGSAIDKATNSIKNKTSELLKSGAYEPGYIAAKRDSAAIGSLRQRVTDLAKTFEDTISTIREHPYDEQIQLLAGYKKLLEEQVNVLESRIHFVKRLH